MIKFDMKELTPWADIHRILSTAHTLTVKVDDEEYSAGAILSEDDAHNVVLELFPVYRDYTQPEPPAKYKVKK